MVEARVLAAVVALRLWLPTAPVTALPGIRSLFHPIEDLERRVEEPAPPRPEMTP